MDIAGAVSVTAGLVALVYALVDAHSALGLVADDWVARSGRCARRAWRPALINTAQHVGGALGLAVLSSIAAARIADVGGWGPGALAEGFRLAFGVGAGFAARGAARAGGRATVRGDTVVQGVGAVA